MYKHKCAYCNNEYETDTYYSKYCSASCLKLAEEQRKQLYSQKKVKKCKFCGKEFNLWKYSNGNYCRTNYCSNVCSMLDTSNTEKIDDNTYKIKTKKVVYYYDVNLNVKYNYCKACGKKFNLENGKLDKLYCSSDCLSKSYNIFKDNYEETKTRVCKFCGKVFNVPRISDGHFSETVFCSDNCRYLGKSEVQLKAQKQRENTCKERYGVIYPCLTKQCREANHSIISKINQKFAKQLINNKIKFTEEFVIDSSVYDFKINNTNFLIELNPSYTHTVAGNHFNSFQYNSEFEDYHINKTKLALANGYHCIHIWDWDTWNKIINLVRPVDVSLFAKDLKLDILNKQIANKILEKYHIQGKCKSNVIVCLKLDDEPIQFIVFGKTKHSKNFEWELYRFYTKSGYKVVGGFACLFNYFLKQYKPNSIISYCDLSKFSTDVYKNLDFSFYKHIKPQKIWSKGNIHITDSLLNLRGYNQIFNDNFEYTTNNTDLMLKHNWLPIFDCGQDVYIYKR